MKIYPGNHNIVLKDKVNTKTDVQISYISNNDTTVSISIESDFISNSTDPLVPYEALPSLNVLVFDEYDNSIDTTNLLMKDENEVVRYIPTGNTIDPIEFSYSVIGKRNQGFNKLKNYYINVKAVGTTEEDSPLDKVTNTFLYANSRGICPSQIIFNDTFFQNINTEPREHNDFLFVYGKVSDESIESLSDIVYPECPECSNVWVLVDDDKFSNDILTNYDTKTKYQIRNVVYESINFDESVKFFSLSKCKTPFADNAFSLCPDNNNGYAPVIITEDTVNRRYVLYSPKSLFDNIENKCKTDIIIEHIVQVYLRSYIKSQSYTTWISDEVPDYVVKNHKLIKQLQFTSFDTYYSILKENASDVEFIDINISNSDIAYTIDASDYIVFKNTKMSNSDKHGEGMSIYCHNKKIVYCEKLYYLKRCNILDCISYGLDDLGNFTVFFDKDYIDSYNGIFIRNGVQKATEDQINTSQISNIIIYGNSDGSIDLFADNNNHSGIALATITISPDTNTKRNLYDIRLRGGGLPKNKNTQYQCMFDVGSIKGMSYRMGGSIIIKLPKEFKSKESIITNSINKHINGSAKAFIVYY